QLYATNGGKIVACAAMEDHFWQAFAKAIGLPAEFIDDKKDTQATINAVRNIIAGQTAAHWAPIFAKADCCAGGVVNLEDALEDPHFVESGLFKNQISTPGGKTIPALPLPIAPQFRAGETTKPAPPLETKSKR